jgi:hypothetical protein
MKRSLLTLTAAALALAGLALSGCANAQLVRVHPWERGTLADYTMRPDRDPAGQTLIQHAYFAREASTGGSGVGGTGCGCNE